MIRVSGVGFPELSDLARALVLELCFTISETEATVEMLALTLPDALARADGLPPRMPLDVGFNLLNLQQVLLLEQAPSRKLLVIGRVGDNAIFLWLVIRD